MAGPVDIRDVPELKAAVAAFAHLPTEIKRQINQQTRAVANPVWQGEVASRLRSPMDRKVLGAGVRVKAGNPIVLQAAQSVRPIDGRLRPADDWQGWEFGTDRNKVTKYDRKTKGGGSTEVTRHASRQMPPRYRRGRVPYPAFAETAPRLAALWVSTVIRCIFEAAEGKRS